jgi:hypothetical protein
MSKAIEGAALLAGAVAIGATEFLLASTGVGIAALPALTDAMGALAAGGLAMEAGAIASALTSNRGMNITTRQPASPRPIIYGMQRVGGVLVYRSTSLADKSQYNHVMVLAAHPCWAIAATYIDGRKVYWDGEGYGQYKVLNGFGFGGWADGNSREGPDGNNYSFGHDVFGEIADGYQQGEDDQFFTSLRANDPAWATTSQGTPYCGGCFCCYLKLSYDPGNFPQDPEIRFTVMGKMVYDPRTGETTYSANSALVCADWIQDTEYFVGMPVNQEQLIAAANVCDEQVALAAGGTEARYTCHYHFDTSTAPSDALATMLKSMGGRISVIGGEVYIWPAYWQGPSANFDEKVLTAGVNWDSTAAYKDNCNRVTGTYTAPNYPYSVAGNLYDSNGFDADGNVQNNFQFGFQPTNFPQYAQDPQHGYAADEWLNEDSGVSAAYDPTVTYALGDVVSYIRTVSGESYASVQQSLVDSNTGNTPGSTSDFWKDITGSVALPLEVNYNMVLSIAQAQRLAKIDLLRRRFWGRGELEMGLAAFTLQECDVMNFTFPLHGWADKQLEIANTIFKTITEEGQPGQPPKPPECRVTFSVQETSELIYEWEASEELSIYDVPVMTQLNTIVAPPTDVAVASSAATANIGADGIVTPRISVTWNTPQDGAVTQIELEYQVTGAPTWTSGGKVSVELNQAFLGPVVSGGEYDVRIRSVRPNGAVSVWVEIDGLTIGNAISILTQDGYGKGSLVPEAYASGGAAIECMPFMALIGQLSLPIFPSGPVTIPSLAQQTLYYVYYIDPNVVGGDVTPIATTNKSDFLGKNGYFLIDSCVTPYAATGISGRYSPSTFNDTGTRATTSPAAAYDGTLSTYATVSGRQNSSTDTEGTIRYSGFDSVVISSAMTLTVNCAVLMNGPTAPPGQIQIDVDINGTFTTILLATAVAAAANYTCAIPSGTALNTVRVTIDASASVATGLPFNNASCQVNEIYIQ